MSLCETVPGPKPNTWKVAAYFFKPMPKLATLTKSGLIRFKIKTKEHMTWQLVRLCGWGATLVTDSVKGYGSIDQGKFPGMRPDVNHEDSNHSKGFAHPGPKSIAKGITRKDTNIVEGGGHGASYKLGRGWVGTKIGSGSDKHEQHVKDLIVAHRNWNAKKQDSMQEMLLWLRLMFGTLKPTALENEVVALLGLQVGNPPDWDSALADFEAIDVQKEPWEFIVGPELPVRTKEGTTKPPGFELALSALVRSKQEEQQSQQDAHVAAGGSPLSAQIPPVSMGAITAPLVFASASKRPRNKATDRARKGKNKENKENKESTEDPRGLRQPGVFGAAFVPPMGTKRKEPEISLFHPKHAAVVVDATNHRQPPISAFIDADLPPPRVLFAPTPPAYRRFAAAPTKPRTPEQRAAKEETSKDGEARGSAVVVDDSPPAPARDLNAAFVGAAAGGPSPAPPLLPGDRGAPPQRRAPPQASSHWRRPWARLALGVAPLVDLTNDNTNPNDAT